MKKKAIYTGIIPQCPHCEKPTIRREGFNCNPPEQFLLMYDENGIEIRNKKVGNWHCAKCKNKYTVSKDEFYITKKV